MSTFMRKENRETLVCKDCNHEFPTSMFTKKGKNKSTGALQFSSRCKPCHRKHVKGQPSYYVESKDRQEKRDLITSLKIKCIVCGYDRCVSALDFHHIDGSEKEANVGCMVMDKDHSLDDVKAEISKCIVVCSNCHREHHSGLIDLTSSFWDVNLN